MNLKEETLEIEDMVFRTQQLPAMKAFTLLARLAKAIGPAMGALMQLGPNAQLEATDTIMAAFAQLNADEATRLVPEILSNTSVIMDRKEYSFSGKSTDNINLIFSGRLGLMFKVIVHALKVNYADFTAGSVPAAPQTPTPVA